MNADTECLYLAGTDGRENRVLRGLGNISREAPASQVKIAAETAATQAARARYLAKRRCTLRSLDICINGLIFRFLGVARSENVL